MKNLTKNKMKYNLESYKATLEQMAEKQTFRLAEIYPRRFDVFYVLKQNKYIHQIDYGVYEWSGKRPNIRTAKRVAMLTNEYRRSWTSSKNKTQTRLELKTNQNTEKQMDKEKTGAIATMVLIGVVVLATIINFIIYFNL
jgi:hypothetical protein